MGQIKLQWPLTKPGRCAAPSKNVRAWSRPSPATAPKDPSTLIEEFNPDPGRDNLEGMRIGVVQEDWTRNGEPEVQRGFDEAQKVLTRPGAELRPMSLPDFPYDEVSETIVASEAACIFEPLITSGTILELA